MGRGAGITLFATIAAGLICVGVAVREWDYHRAHRYASGPSLYIAAIGVAGALIAFSVAWLINRLDVQASDARIRTRYGIE